jgi:hypothetical protein
VIVLFGSEGLYSYTLDGKLEWQEDLGTLDMAPSDEIVRSPGTSRARLCCFEDTIIVQSDSKKDSFLAEAEV